LRFATSGEEALRLTEQSLPDLVVLDVEMPGMNGFEVCRRLKARPEFADVPIIFLTSHDDEQLELFGLSVGAVDFISKPPRAGLVRARTRVHLRIKELSDALRLAAATDGLTDVANRRHFEQSMSRERARVMRSGRPTSLLMIDVDHFKAYNDRYGHPTGDQCLRSVASALQSACCRSTDLIARYGGEEFAVLLPETDHTGAEHVARKVLANVSALQIPHEGSTVAKVVTVSLGVSSYAPSTLGHPSMSRSTLPDFLEVVRCADAALYAAKHAGRNRAFALAVTQRGDEQATPVPSGRPSDTGGLNHA
ncbi:MAG TPA: diguanylate cyclase, partial [Polyangiales bacterium]